ncbi:MAG TPA: hypothetical protein VK612_13535 [Pyrinomonadaceae bacterium]|nr:hypothetical protein [Pyrinomonadaceae bacterium]
MTKNVLAILASSVFLASACGSTTDPNSNANRPGNVNGANSNGLVKVNANALPPEFSPNAVTPSANSTPGIPAPANVNVPKGATPTPGIPDPKTLGKPMKPGVTPTPGIPDPETLRRQLQKRNDNVNVNTPPPGGSDTSMMKGKKKPRPINGQ